MRVPEEQAPLKILNVQENLTYNEHPVKIFWRPLRELLGTRRSRRAECNGVTYREGELRKRMVVKSSGKEQISSYICSRVSMRIDEATFPEDLIVMKSTGIDIILGQNWSARNKLVMQPTKRVVKVKTLLGEQIEHEVQHPANSSHVGMRIRLRSE